jgi:hypothetical protein
MLAWAVRRGAVLRRRGHHSRHLGALRRRRPGESTRRRFKPYVVPLVADHPGGAFRDAAARHRQPSVRCSARSWSLWFLDARHRLGVISIAHARSVLGALNPVRMRVRSFAEQPAARLHVAGRRVLARDRCEALYADMGHFGHSADPRSPGSVWCCPPGAQLFRSGRAAAEKPEGDREPLLPARPRRGHCMPMVALATAATVHRVAGGHLGRVLDHPAGDAARLLPRAWRSVHTSAHARSGRSTCPRINWALLLSVVALVIGFQNSSNLAAAYGIAVTGTMFVTDMLAFRGGTPRVGLAGMEGDARRLAFRPDRSGFSFRHLDQDRRRRLVSPGLRHSLCTSC